MLGTGDDIFLLQSDRKLVFSQGTGMNILLKIGEGYLIVSAIASLLCVIRHLRTKREL
jgi:hypothetical protein